MTIGHDIIQTAALMWLVTISVARLLGEVRRRWLIRRLDQRASVEANALQHQRIDEQTDWEVRAVGADVKWRLSQISRDQGADHVA